MSFSIRKLIKIKEESCRRARGPCRRRDEPSRNGEGAQDELHRLAYYYYVYPNRTATGSANRFSRFALMRSLLLALAASRGASVRGPVVRSLPSARRGVPRLSDDWMFVGMREQMADNSRELRAIVDPFGRSMLVGEEQWQRISSPELLLQLNAARQADALLARIPSISCTGAQ